MSVSKLLQLANHLISYIYETLNTLKFRAAIHCSQLDSRLQLEMSAFNFNFGDDDMCVSKTGTKCKHVRGD